MLPLQLKEEHIERINASNRRFLFEHFTICGVIQFEEFMYAELNRGICIGRKVCPKCTHSMMIIVRKTV